MSVRRLRVLNTWLDVLDLQEALARSRDARVIVTPNIDHLANLQWSSDFRAAYAAADLAICDSRILALMLRLLGYGKVPPLPGSDFFPAMCESRAGDVDFRPYLVGGTTEHALAQAMEVLTSRYGVRVAGGVSPPFGFDTAANVVEDIAREIVESGATVVAVGVGSPKQELVMERLNRLLPAGITLIGVGATIDFLGGRIARAPRLFRWLCLEWLYRLVKEPRRLWRRYLVNDLPVLALLVAFRMGLYHPPLEGPARGRSAR